MGVVGGQEKQLLHLLSVVADDDLKERKPTCAHTLAYIELT